MVRVLKIEPRKEPVEATIGNSLEDLQKAVGGYIEMIGLQDDCCILCNEEGKLLGLTPNRIYGTDVIAGTFYVVRTNEDGNIVNLTDEDVSRYSEIFRKPVLDMDADTLMNLLGLI